MFLINLVMLTISIRRINCWNKNKLETLGYKIFKRIILCKLVFISSLASSNPPVSWHFWFYFQKKFIQIMNLKFDPLR